MSTQKCQGLPLAARQLLLDELYQNWLFRPVVEQSIPATRRPRANEGKDRGAPCPH